MWFFLSTFIPLLSKRFEAFVDNLNCYVSLSWHFIDNFWEMLAFAQMRRKKMKFYIEGHQKEILGEKRSLKNNSFKGLPWRSSG